MWLFTRYGFYSIACAQNAEGALDPALVMVRARRIAHLENLQVRFPEMAVRKIERWPDRDYRYRLLLSKRQWAKVITALSHEQHWSNFKDEAARFQGQAGSAYVKALHDTWRIMYRLQLVER